MSRTNAKFQEMNYWDVIRRVGIADGELFAQHPVVGVGDSNWLDIISELRRVAILTRRPVAAVEGRGRSGRGSGNTLPGDGRYRLLFARLIPDQPSGRIAVKDRC